MKNIKASSNAMLQFITPEMISKFNFRYLSIFNGNTFALFHSYNVIPSTLNLLNYRFACGQRTSKYMLYYVAFSHWYFAIMDVTSVKCTKLRLYKYTYMMKHWVMLSNACVHDTLHKHCQSETKKLFSTDLTKADNMLLQQNQTACQKNHQPIVY